jgi:hypothetical protein
VALPRYGVNSKVLLGSRYLLRGTDRSEFNKPFPNLKKDRNKFFGYFRMNPETFDYVSEKKFSEAGKSLCCLSPKLSAYMSIVILFQVWSHKGFLSNSKEINFSTSISRSDFVRMTARKQIFVFKIKADEDTRLCTTT